MPIMAANNLPIARKGECNFVACFEVRSAQPKSEVIRVRISWNGKWNDGDAEMGNNLKLKVL